MRKIFHWFEAFFTIIGGVIGLGVLAIPYALKNIGLTPGTLLILVVAILMIFLNILFAEIIIFTKKDECIIAYAKRYLGNWAKKLEFFSILFGYSGSLLAYTLAVAVFIRGVLSLDESFFWPIVLVFTMVSVLILVSGFNGLGKLEFLLAVLMVGLFLFIFERSYPYAETVRNNWSNIFLPYGVVFFAFTGEATIPIAVKILGEEKKKIKNVIIWAYVVVILMTLLFFFSAIRVGGEQIGPDPFIAMSEKMGEEILFVGSFLGLLAVVTSHWAIASYLKKILISDLNFKPNPSLLLVALTPLVFILLGASNFVHIIGAVGVVAGTIDALIILTIYQKIFSQKKNKTFFFSKKVTLIFVWALFGLLFLAAISSILSLKVV